MFKVGILNKKQSIPPKENCATLNENYKLIGYKSNENDRLHFLTTCNKDKNKIENKEKNNK
tara:strand:+ start:37 stop:219 length:183 start_codon:yes stop_codon:yes gene_type:complete